jgi:hypothetical protein
MNRPLLEKPFESANVKQRQGTFGNTLDYVEGHAVVARLNEAFEANWTFELSNHWILKETDEVLVLGKLTAEGITKMAFGSMQISRNEDTKAIISLGDDLKAASTDALKKAASLLGVGLYLYSNPKNKTGEAPPKESPKGGNGERNGERKDGQQKGNGGNGGNGIRLTNKQLSAIFAIGKSKGLKNKDLKEKAQTLFSKNLDFLTKEEASSFIKTLQSN